MVMATHHCEWSSCHSIVHVKWLLYILMVSYMSCTFYHNEKKNTVQFRCSVMSDSLQPHGLQHIRPPCPPSTPGVYTNSCALSLWCHPTISSSVVPFSSCLNLSQHQGLFKWHQLTSGGQSIGDSASASVLPMNIRDWFPLGWTGWISLLLKGLSRVFSNITVQKHQFLGSQLSL